MPRSGESKPGRGSAMDALRQVLSIRKTRGGNAARARTGSRAAARRLLLEDLEGRRVLTSLPFGASELDLGEFLLGDVAVTPVLLESNGVRDPSTEDWTSSHVDEVLGKINTGLQWWEDTLATKTNIHELNFSVDTTYADRDDLSSLVQTSYEPISRRSNDYTLYMTEFLAAVGFNQTGNLERDIRAFNHAQREKLDTDWSFTIIVVPSQNDSDGQFQAGGSFSRAFAFAGGLFMIVPSTRPASTFAHELGHIFWGRDEYPGGGTFFQRRGYYNTQNLNAHDNPTPGFVQQPSIMAAGDLLGAAYANNTSPDSTLAMVGWQDSDGDGIFDVLDVPHRLTGTGYLDPTSSTYRFIGEATVQTLPNLNPAGQKNDITLNLIREIEYRFDGGPWQLHSMPGIAQVDLDLSINVPDGVTDIEIRARDSKSTVVSNTFSGRLDRADATSVPGINGFVWIDGNKNGLRDVGEYGQQFWTVELVDGSGNVLDLKKSIEPDDFPDGQLTSGFSTDVTLASLGTDADGRVGVFADNLVSTGTKNFRGFSRSAQSYLSSWSSETRRLEVSFSTPTSLVSIDAIGSFNNAFGRMDAFNAAGELIGRYTTAELSSGGVETMTIERGAADIARVVVGGHASSTVRLDNLRFGPETSVFTGEQGHYAFSSLPAGNYNVRVTPSSEFTARDPAGGQQVATVAANTATTDVDFGFESSTSDWQNSRDENDVNDDTVLSALDVLLIVNEINQNGARDLRGSGLSTPPYIDVSGDSFVSALDVLLVVNAINSAGLGGEGELIGPNPTSGASAGGSAGSGDSVPLGPLMDPLSSLPESDFSGSNGMIGEGESGASLVPLPLAEHTPGQPAMDQRALARVAESDVEHDLALANWDWRPTADEALQQLLG